MGLKRRNSRVKEQKRQKSAFFILLFQKLGLESLKNPQKPPIQRVFDDLFWRANSDQSWT
jgi:hypothetical protein